MNDTDQPSSLEDSSMNSSQSIDDTSSSDPHNKQGLLGHLQGFFRRHNATLMRRLSDQTLLATNDLNTFKNWFYQDLDKHRHQLQEAGSSLFFRTENKFDNRKFDLVITFTRGCDDSLVCEFQELLKHDQPALVVELRKHYFANYVENALYITANQEFFEHLASKASQNITADVDSHLSRYYPHSKHFSSFQRQSILNCVLNAWYFEDPPERYQHLGQYLTPDKAITSRLTTLKVIDQVFPLHHDEDLQQLKQQWVIKFFASQPLDKICAYFGIKIAIYFAFIGFYTHCLLYPTFFGLFVTYFTDVVHSLQANEQNIIFQWLSVLQDPLIDDCLLFAFTIFNIFWSTFFLQKWEHKCRSYTSKWISMVPTDVLQAQVDWQSQRTQSTQDRHLRQMIFKYLVTFPIIGLSLVITFTIMFKIFNFQTWWDTELIEKENYPQWTRFVPKVLLALIVNSSNWIYYAIALWLNNKENYSGLESQENNLIIKLVLFQFLNSFLPLLYIAFYLGDLNKLKEQLATHLITRQVIGNFNEAVWPFLKESYRLVTRKLQHREQAESSMDGINERSLLSKGELESCMFSYESTFDDYLELAVQFGYVMLFAPVFPLAACCSFLNNLIEIRSDAFKLCVVYQRPFGSHHANTIGEWSNVFHYLSVAAISTNCALMALTGLLSRVFAFFQPTSAMLTAVVIEHVLLLLKWLIPTLNLV